MKKIALHGIAILMALCLIISCDNSPKTKTFTVTFDSDGGTEVEAMTVEAGKTVTEPAIPTKEGNYFVEWQLNDAAYDFNEAVKSDLSLTALWSPNNVWDGKTVDTAWYANDKTTFTISTAPELAGLAKLVNDKTDNKNTSFEGKTITLNADLDLNNKDWTPIGNADSGFTVGTKKYHAFNGTFDGNGHTIKNLKVDSTAKNTDPDGYYASGLFGWAMDKSEIKGLTIDGAVVDGHHYVAAVVGYDNGKVSSCSVKNATLTNTHACEEGCGDKTGAIVGYWLNAGTIMTECSATKCTIKGARDVGQLVGAIQVEACVDTETCSATEVTVAEQKEPACTHKDHGQNIKNEKYGRVVATQTT